MNKSLSVLISLILTSVVTAQKPPIVPLLPTPNPYVNITNRDIPGAKALISKKDSVLVSKQKGFSYYRNQHDLVDVALALLHKERDKRLDSAMSPAGKKLHLSAAPIFEYTLSTGFATGIASNGAFFMGDPHNTNTSSFLAAIKYTQKKQFLLPIQTSVWTPGNRYNFLGDWRYLNFPQDTYGFGGSTTDANRYVVTYKYIRFYESILKKIRKDFYLGIGYQLDRHWGIKEIDVPIGDMTDFQKYGLAGSSTSSGMVINILYDSRKNSINPEGGSFYGNLAFTQNSKLMGSSSNWNSVLLDLRKYVRMPHGNVLAFWFYGMVTLDGNPPYLDLPGTGLDTYNNTGRGYEQGRFIGKKMIDLETEFRFGISRDGLLGGVVFGNAESLSELGSNRFNTISAGFGIGLRIKLNKFSNTNACIDYGVGKNGSRGFFGNLGEVF